jgi:MFS family permease
VIEMVAMGSVLGVGFITLMPVTARDVLGLGAGGYGALLASLGAGAMVAGLGLAAYGPRISRRGRFLAATATAFPVILVAYSAVRAPWLAGAALVVAGGMMILNNATANTLLQTLVPDALRGRVLATYVLVFIGVAPVGSLLAGAVARAVGAPAAIGGLALLLLGYVRWALARYPALREA